MQTKFAYYCLTSYFVLSLIILICTGYVYRVNAKRTADDLLKRDYHPLAVPLAVTWPLYALTWTTFFILKALAYGVFLIFFTLALVFIRKPIIFKWLDKAATKIGTFFLKVNTFLIRSFSQKTSQGVA